MDKRIPGLLLLLVWLGTPAGNAIAFGLAEPGCVCPPQDQFAQYLAAKEAVAAAAGDHDHHHDHSQHGAHPPEHASHPSPALAGHHHNHPHHETKAGAKASAPSLHTVPNGPVYAPCTEEAPSLVAGLVFPLVSQMAHALDLRHIPAVPADARVLMDRNLTPPFPPPKSIQEA
jgi:hypothetical protein